MHSSPVKNVELTWHPEYPLRAVVTSTDNAVRLINPATGKILTSALINPPNCPVHNVVYIPQYGKQS